MTYPRFVNSSNRSNGNLAINATGVMDSEESRHLIATFFRDHRLRCGVPLEDLAQCVGDIEASELAAFEKGKKPIPLDVIFSLTNCLNIPPEDVMNLIYDISKKP